jgi:protein phosphatase
MNNSSLCSSPSTWVHFAHATDPGQVRDHNEDRVLVQLWADSSTLLAVVADGMGGHQGGEVAAQITIDTFAKLLEQPLPSEPSQRYELLAQSFHIANQSIKESASTSFNLMDMGATVVAAIVTPTDYLYLNAGDCRFYHLGADGRTLRRSKDHTVMQVLLDLGQITEEQIPLHPMRSIVNSCLGGRGNKQISIDPQWQADNPPIFPWQAGDILLLSSDGMHGAISSAQIQELVAQQGKNPADLVQVCIDAANAAGGNDNISVVAIALSPLKIEFSMMSRVSRPK